jgi:hypothetical protein
MCTDAQLAISALLRDPFWYIAISSLQKESFFFAVRMLHPRNPPSSRQKF